MLRAKLEHLRWLHVCTCYVYMGLAHAGGLMLLRLESCMKGSQSLFVYPNWHWPILCEKVPLLLVHTKLSMICIWWP